jgi:hypothetical protein
MQPLRDHEGAGQKMMAGIINRHLEHGSFFRLYESSVIRLA